MTAPVVLLVTCSALPDGEPRGDLLLAACAARGLDARWVVWDDPTVAWADADLVAVRSTWDYETRREEFLEWARGVGPRLLNGADVFTWNTDKRYLVELSGAGLPVVPTLFAEYEGELPPAIAAYDCAVVKPTVGAGGRGVVVFDGEDGGVADLDESLLMPGPWVVQPLVESVRTEGEHSVFVLDGRAVAQVTKRPAGEEIRVHTEYGGRSDAVALDPVAARLAEELVATVAQRLGRSLPYARADLMRLDGRLVLSELEVTEPGLYLDVRPELADAFADLLAQLSA
ncbi:MAG: hypothetical protein Q8Q02_02655 [Nocardioides sp.]|nr:hypothetical protein [Nocardioides sp.]